MHSGVLNMRPDPAGDSPVRPQSATSAPDLRPDYLRLFILFVGSRALILLVAWFSLLGIGKPKTFSPPRSIADWFVHWDAGWYLDVARNGYHFSVSGQPQTNVGYLPLYPWLVRIASLGGRVDYRFAGYVVSLAGLWLGCVLLWRLVAREWGNAETATLAVVFLLFGPVSFFFSSLYSESWFLPLSIGCLLCARDRRWWLAGGLGALAALTRLVGVALVVPLAWEWLSQRPTAAGGRRHARSWAALSACALPAAGYLCYCAMMWVKFGNPMMYAEAQLDSGRHFTWFWGLLVRPSFLGLGIFYQVWLGGSLLLGFALLLAGVLLRIPTSFSIFALTFTFIYISARFVDSLPRYFSALFPVYVVAALCCRRWPRLTPPLLASSAALLTLSVILFVNGYWFT